MLSQLAAVEIFKSISVNLPERKQKRIVLMRSEITDVTLLNYLSLTPSLLLLFCQIKSARNYSHKTKTIDGTSALSPIRLNNGRKHLEEVIKKSKSTNCLLPGLSQAVYENKLCG